ncbi:unnamed protein product, partial [Pocillopora meandrina]
GSLVVAFVYKDLHDRLLTDQPIRNETVNKRIMAITIDPKPNKLPENVILKFKNLKVLTAEKRCMFWTGLSKRSEGFSEEGCHVVKSQSNSEETVCSCNHLTHFAVLMDYDGSLKLTKEDETVLKVITYVGLSLSIVGILLTLILYYCLTDVRQPLSQIRLSVSMSLGAGQIIFLAGINATENKAACVTIAALMQYFLMAAFCWMLIEAIYLYLFVVKVYNINAKMHMYHVLSWGLPVIMVAISLGIAAGKEGLQSYTSDKYCWLSSTNNLTWIFVAFVTFIEVGRITNQILGVKGISIYDMTPHNTYHLSFAIYSRKTLEGAALIIEVPWLGVLFPVNDSSFHSPYQTNDLNILILVSVIKEMTKLVQPTAEDNNFQQVRLGIKACVVINPLLGITWLFGLLLPVHKAFAYIFTILNSTQGFLIFALHCMRNNQIKERFKRKMNIVFPSSIKDNATRKCSQVKQVRLY